VCLLGAGVGFYLERNLAYGLFAVLTAAVVPYTLVFMKDTNGQLFGLPEKYEVKTAQNLIRRWARFHSVRTALSIASFLTLLVYIHH